MGFPSVRLRRLRKSEKIRELVSGVALSKHDFVYPVFVKEGIAGKSEIHGMPGQHHHSLHELDKLAEECEAAGVSGVLIFGIPKRKNVLGSEAYNENGIVQRAVKQLKKKSELVVFTDVCLCQYTTHGHCGVLTKQGVDNDRTLRLLAKTAVSHARAGADFVAPSSMMDGQVKAIRDALNASGFEDIGIMSYSAKFASSFYGPFREAVESAPKRVRGLPYLSNRGTYQMDFRSIKQALREISLDVEEGADIIMVKPALPYLDVIREARRKFDLPLAAYQVSGEYAMIKLACMRGLLDERRTFLETLISIKRAGANFIITYAALDAARWLSES
ncbi:MAG: porphobilinogen synthase [Candidatus Hadarchaeaceae archaeon]